VSQVNIARGGHLGASKHPLALSFQTFSLVGGTSSWWNEFRAFRAHQQRKLERREHRMSTIESSRILSPPLGCTSNSPVSYGPTRCGGKTFLLWDHGHGGEFDLRCNDGGEDGRCRPSTELSFSLPFSFGGP